MKQKAGTEAIMGNLTQEFELQNFIYKMEVSLGEKILAKYCRITEKKINYVCIVECIREKKIYLLDSLENNRKPRFKYLMTYYSSCCPDFSFEGENLEVRFSGVHFVFPFNSL